MGFAAAAIPLLTAAGPVLSGIGGLASLAGLFGASSDDSPSLPAPPSPVGGQGTTSPEDLQAQEAAELRALQRRKTSAKKSGLAGLDDEEDVPVTTTKLLGE